MTRITHKSPSLSERLQTAYDNRKESNIIAERLLTEVSTKLDSLSTSSFFERQALSVRVAAIIVLLFGLLTINFVYIQQFGLDIHRDINRNLEDLFGSSSSGGDDTFSMSGGDNWQRGNHSARDETQKIGGQSGGKIPGYAEGPMPGSGGGVGSDASNNIYGAPTSVKIAGEEKPMEIHPEYGGVINIEDDSGEETSSGNYDVPEEIESAGMPEQEPVEYAEVIKSYWEKLSAGEVK